MAPGAPGSPAGAFSACARRGTPPHPLPRPRGAFPWVTRQGPWEKWVKGMEKTPPHRKKKGGRGKNPPEGEEKGPGGDGAPGGARPEDPSRRGPKDHGREALRRRSPEGREKSPREGGKSPPEGAGEGFFFLSGGSQKGPPGSGRGGGRGGLGAVRRGGLSAEPPPE